MSMTESRNPLVESGKIILGVVYQLSVVCKVSYSNTYLLTLLLTF